MSSQFQMSGDLTKSGKSLQNDVLVHLEMLEGKPSAESQAGADHDPCKELQEAHLLLISLQTRA